MDKETQDILNRQANFKFLVESEGWKQAIEIKDEMVKKLMDIRLMPDLKADDLIKEIELRKSSIALFEDFIKVITGQAEMYEANSCMVEKAQSDYLIIKG